MIMVGRWWWWCCCCLLVVASVPCPGASSKTIAGSASCGDVTRRQTGYLCVCRHRPLTFFFPDPPHGLNDLWLWPNQINMREVVLVVTQTIKRGTDFSRQDMADTSSLDAPSCGGQEQPPDGVLPGNAAAFVRSAGPADANPAADELPNFVSSTTPLVESSCNQEVSDDALALQAAGGASPIVLDAAAAEAAVTGAAREAGGGGQAQQTRRIAQAALALAGGLAGQDWHMRAHSGGCSCCAGAGDTREQQLGDGGDARRPLDAPTRSHAPPACSGGASAAARATARSTDARARATSRR